MTCKELFGNKLIQPSFTPVPPVVLDDALDPVGHAGVVLHLERPPRLEDVHHHCIHSCILVSSLGFILAGEAQALPVNLNLCNGNGSRRDLDLLSKRLAGPGKKNSRNLCHP